VLLVVTIPPSNIENWSLPYIVSIFLAVPAVLSNHSPVLSSMRRMEVSGPPGNGVKRFRMMSGGSVLLIAAAQLIVGLCILGMMQPAVWNAPIVLSETWQSC
jgi:hypothetical protein